MFEKVKKISFVIAGLISLSGCQSNTSNTQPSAVPLISTTISQDNMIESIITVHNTGALQVNSLAIKLEGSFTDLNIQRGSINPCQDISSSNPLGPNQECSFRVENDQDNQPPNNSTGKIEIIPQSSAGQTQTFGTPTVLNIKSGTYLYAGGVFTTSNGIAMNRIAKWDGNNWSEVGNGVDGEIDSLTLDNNELYVGGHFSSPGNNIAKWNGKVWSQLGSGLSGYVRALATYSGEVYAGSSEGDGSNNQLVRWSGGSWVTVGGGIAPSNTGVYALASSTSGLYVGGNFTTPENKLALWYANAWSSLDSSTFSNDTVFSIAVSDNNTLYAGGSFHQPTSRIAQWNGTSWSSLGSGIDKTGATPAYVLALASLNGNLYAGGDFNVAGGGAVSNIAKWDGNSWTSLGTGTNGSVSSLVSASNNLLFVGGDFITAGGNTVNNVAKWDGNSWENLGDGFNQQVKSMILAPELEVTN